MRNRRTRRVLLALTAVLALGLVAAACGPTLAPAPPAPMTPQSQQIVDSTNYLRGLGGTAGMTVDGNMQANAQFAADRVAGRIRDCNLLSGSDHSPELASWYPGVSAAENLACVPGCPDNGGNTVFNLWWNSAPHRANMMNPAYTYTGVATSCNGSVMIAAGQYRSG